MALSLKEQQTQDQVSQPPAAAVFQDADIAQTVGTVFPPDAADGDGNGILKNEGVPAQSVAVIRTAVEYCGAHGNNVGKIRTRGKPFP